jgi:hypothetical protein
VLFRFFGRPVFRFELSAHPLTEQAALGKDQRQLANTWLSWSDVALQKLAKARWIAITAEAASPTQPRSSPWSPPLPPPAPKQGAGADADAESLSFAPNPCARSVVARYWLGKCNISALASLVAAAKCDATFVVAVGAASACALGGVGSKRWLINVLASMELGPEQLARLRSPAPAPLPPT